MYESCPTRQVGDGDCNALQFRLGDETCEELYNEAMDSRELAHRVESNECQLEFDGSVNGRGRCWIAGPGSNLRGFHSGIGLEIAKKFAGNRMEVFPTRAAYLHYDEGDFSFLHNDAVHAHITVIVGLTNGLIPLVIFPLLNRVDAGDIASLNEVDVMDDGKMQECIFKKLGERGLSRSIEVPRHHAVAIRGRRYLHARPKQPQAGIICTACYSFLVPPRGWTLM